MPDIVGMGTQIIECVRVRRLIERHGEVFLTRVYTPRELVFCRDRTHSTEHYASVWAAKEAVLRSLGTPWRKGIAWTDIEIVFESGTAPRAVVTGTTRQQMESRGVRTILVSLAHSRHFATAHAIAMIG